MGNRPQGMKNAGHNADLLKALQDEVNLFVTTSRPMLNEMGSAKTLEHNGP